MFHSRKEKTFLEVQRPKCWAFFHHPTCPSSMGMRQPADCRVSEGVSQGLEGCWKGWKMNNIPTPPFCYNHSVWHLALATHYAHFLSSKEISTAWLQIVGGNMSRINQTYCLQWEKGCCHRCTQGPKTECPAFLLFLPWACRSGQGTSSANPESCHRVGLGSGAAPTSSYLFLSTSLHPSIL